VLGTIVGPTRYLDPRDNVTRFCLDLLDLDATPLTGPAAEPERIALDFFGHGFAVHPTRSHEAVVLEKRGPGGCAVDLREKRVTQTIAPLEGHAFYGHGAFSSSGEALFAVEMDLGSSDGVISVRDAASSAPTFAPTFAPIGRFPTYGAAPHDCHLVEDGKVLMITNGGGALDDPRAPSVTFVDVATEKLLEKFEVSEPRVNTGHVAMLPGRVLAVVSAPRHGLPQETGRGGVSLRIKGPNLLYRDQPATVTSRFVGESLSVCIHAPTRTAATTHPFGNLITFWNLDAMALVAALDLVSVRGVTTTLDGRYYAVSFGAQASLLLLETSPLKMVQGRDPGTRRFGGSHIYTWAGLS
jgi:hypothetical protein